MQKRKRLNVLSEKINLFPEFYYILGAFKGDGHYNFKRNCIQIGVIDLDFLEYIKHIFNEISPQTRIKIVNHVKAKNNSKEQFRINLCCKDFFDRKLYLLEPITVEQKIWYLRGLFDAEGSCGLFIRKIKRKNKEIVGHDKWLTIHQKNIMDLEKWSLYLNELNINTNKSYVDNSRSSLRIRDNYSIKLFNDIIGFRIKRKQKRLDDIIAYINKWHLIRHFDNLKKVKIKNITLIGEKETVDLETPIYNNFLLDNGILSHNSVFAIQMCAYMSYLLQKYKMNKNAFGLDNVYYDNKKMMKDTLEKKEKFRINLYDEGRESLAASKSMTTLQQDVIDFFTECGQLNNIFVICIPDYFEMKESIAVPRSECLFNITVSEKMVKNHLSDDPNEMVMKWDRGYFNFFNRKAKKLMYDMYRTTHAKDYGRIKSSFPAGSFEKANPLGEEEYRKLKYEALTRFSEKEQEEKLTPRQKEHIRQRDILIKDFLDKGIYNKKQISELLGIPYVTLAMHTHKNKDIFLAGKI